MYRYFSVALALTILCTSHNVCHSEEVKDPAQVYLRRSADNHDDTATVPSQNLDVDLEVQASFKSKHKLKADSKLEFHDFRQNNQSFYVNEKKYSFENAAPMDIYSEGATFSLDGEEMMPLNNDESNVFIIEEGDETILITRDEGQNGAIQSIFVMFKNGPEIYLESIAPDILVTIKNEDMDPEYAKILDKLVAKGIYSDYNNDNFNIEGEEVTSEETAISFLPENITKEKRELQLSNGCSKFYIIKVAIVFDSTFCGKTGSKWGKAKTQIDALFAKASVLYQNQGVCTKIQMSKIDGYCSSGDPYKNVVSVGNIGCGTKTGVLQKFSALWKNNKGNVVRTVSHFFFAKDFHENTIGCAYIDNLCNKGQGYGVSNLNLYTNPQMRAILFAHELGHNIGLQHVTSAHTNPKWIMRINPGQGGGWHQWSPTSLNRLKNLLNEWKVQYGCINQV